MNQLIFKVSLALQCLLTKNKKKAVAFLFAASLCLTAIGEEPIIKLVTSKSPGSSINFYALGFYDNAHVRVDFGGNIVDETILTNSFSYVGGTMGNSDTIKIYGAVIRRLDCNDMQLTSIDVSNYPELRNLNCSDNMLTFLDLSKNIDLELLDCNNNQLTSLDLTHNTKLNNFLCLYNQLTSLTIDASKNVVLKYVQCGSNQLNFATLPLQQGTYSTYDYSPQGLVPIVNAINLGAEIDLHDQSMVGTNYTVYTWKIKRGPDLIEGTDYVVTNGRTIFLKAQTDSVYCEMTNVSFPGLIGADALKTTNVKILGIERQAQAITFNNDDEPLELTATSSSGLPLIITSSDSEVASVSGNVVAVHKNGTTAITAFQPGNNLWFPAMGILTLSVSGDTIVIEPTGISQETKNTVAVYPNPVSDRLYLSGTDLKNADASIYNQVGVKVWSGIAEQNSIDVSALPSGYYVLKISCRDKQDGIVSFIKQ